jgi:hypothetical protein
MDGADVGSGMQEAPFDLEAQAVAFVQRLSEERAQIQREEQQRRQSLAQLAQRVIDAYRVEQGLAGTFLLQVTDPAAGPAIAPEPNVASNADRSSASSSLPEKLPQCSVPHCTCTRKVQRWAEGSQVCKLCWNNRVLKRNKGKDWTDVGVHSVVSFSLIA